VKFILKPDYRLMRRVQQWYPPSWVRQWMILASRAGDGWLWVAIGAALALLGGPAGWRAAAAGALAAGVGILLFVSLKRLAGRRRPCELQPQPWVTLLPPDQFSFPSGHTITAFAVSVTWSLFFPRLAPGLAFCALSVAASRIVLGMHFLSDVLAGIAIGTGLGYAAFLVLG